MNGMSYVRHSSTILSTFLDEFVAETIARRMGGALLRAVNYYEVVTKVVDRGLPDHNIIDIMEYLDVEVVPVDRAQALAASLPRDALRNAGLSPGDRSCLTLAETRKATALTADPRLADARPEHQNRDRMLTNRWRVGAAGTGQSECRCRA